MKRFFFCSLIICSAASYAAAGLYVERFSSDNAGWLATTVNNSGTQVASAASWSSTGGNLNGHIYASVDNDSTRLYGLAPANTSAYGNLTGLTLTTDYRIEGEITGPTNMTVRFYVGTYTGGYNYFVSNSTVSWNPNADKSWTTHQVDLVAANFVEWPNQASHTKTFAEVIAAPEDIGLVFADGFTSNSTLGFSSINGATIHVDNFGVVPLPASILLGVFAVGLAGRKLRKFV